MQPNSLANHEHTLISSIAAHKRQEVKEDQFSPQQLSGLYIFPLQASSQDPKCRGNPSILWGRTGQGAGFCLPAGGVTGDQVRKGKRSHRQAGSGSKRVAPRQTSISNCHQQLYPTASRYTRLLSARGLRSGAASRDTKIITRHSGEVCLRV